MCYKDIFQGKKIDKLLIMCLADYFFFFLTSFHQTTCGPEGTGKLNIWVQVFLSVFHCGTAQSSFMSSRKTNENSTSDSSLTISITLIFVPTYSIAILGVLITKFKFLSQQSNSNSKAVQPIKEVCVVEGGRRAGTSSSSF